MVRHIVFWKIKDDDNKQVNLEQMKQLLLNLTSNISGIVSTEIGFNFSSSDYDLILDAVFKDPFSLKQYQSHPDILRINSFIQPILVDRVVCDYMINNQESLNKNIPDVNLSNKTEPQAQSFSHANNSGFNNGLNSAPKTIANAPKNNSLANTNPLNNVIGSLNKSLMNPKRDTLAMSPSTLSDDAFALPYERNLNQNEDTFNLPSFNNQNNSQNNAFNNRSDMNNYSSYSQGMGNNSSRNPMGGMNGMNNSNNSMNNMNNMNGGYPNSSNNMSGSMGNQSYNPMNNGYSPSNNNRQSGQYGDYNQSNMGMQSNNSNYGYHTGMLPQLDISNMNQAQGRQGNDPRRMDPSGYASGNSVELPWKCPQCGKLNAAFAGTCNCGFRKPPRRSNQMQQQNNDYRNRQSNNRKPMPSLSLPGPEIPANAGSSIFDSNSSMMHLDQNNASDGTINAWVCSSCGKVNGDFVGMCSCGQRKPSRNDMGYGSNSYAQQSRQPNNRKSYGRQHNGSNPSASGSYRSMGESYNTYKNKSMDTINNAIPVGNEPYISPDVYDMNEPVIQMPPNNQQPPRRGGGTSQSNNGWKCPRCGKIHGGFVGQCGCGQRRPSRNNIAY